MGQIRRVVAFGCPHHITERGNFGRDVFLDDDDCLTYLYLLAEYSRDARLHVLGYRLISNHI